MDYTEGVLDPTDDSETGTARLRAWCEAVNRGFHQGRPNEDSWAVFQETTLADGVVPRGLWLPEGEFGAGRLPVATYSAFDKDLNVGGGSLVPTRMITDVTVSPAHRRRGLLRRMIEADLSDAATAGVPTACLTVSEATIYDRFGFGAATFGHTIEIDTSAGFRIDGPADTGRTELVEPADHWETIHEVFTGFHAQHRGSVRRPHFYRALLTGTHDLHGDGSEKKTRLAVHLAADGRPDGYVLYQHQGWEAGPRTVKVKDFLALDHTSTLALWRFLGSVDLTERVTWSNAPAPEELRWALADQHRLKVTSTRSHLWVRVLDVAAALTARPWYADGEVVLDVADPQGHAAGRWAIEVSGGRATVARTDAAADPATEVRLPAHVLGSLYLGAVGIGTLARTGRIEGTPEAAQRFAALADGGPAPYCATSF